MQLDHVTLRTRDLEGTKDFFTDVLGLRVGDRPPLKFPGYWLYGAGPGNETALIHLMPGEAEGPDTGTVDHIAFRGGDYAAMIVRLGDHGVAFNERTIPGRGVRQVFVEGPHGLKIEINFAAEG